MQSILLGKEAFFKKVAMLLMVLTISLFLSACTNDKKENKDDISKDSNLEIIDDSSDDQESDPVETDTDIDLDEETTVEGNNDSDTTTDTTTPPPTSTQSGDITTLEGASASNGVRIVAYAYGGNGSVFEFDWVVSGSTLAGKPNPTVTGQYNAQNQLVITFPSLAGDYIATSDKIELPGVGFDVLTSSQGGASTYTFETTSKKDFRFTVTQNDEGKDVVRLQINR